MCVKHFQYDSKSKFRPKTVHEGSERE